MISINSISITGWVEHLKSTPEKTAMYMEIYQNVFGKKLTRYIIFIPNEFVEEIKSLHIHKGDVVFISNAKTYEMDGQLRVAITGTKQVSVIERKTFDCGERELDEFL